MIGDDVAAALPELQRQAESLMVTPCTVVRPTGVTADPVTGADVETSEPVYGTDMEPGRCKLQGRDNQIRTVESGLSSVALQQMEVHLPVTSGPYRRGDLIRADGRRFRILGIPTKTWQTAQRLPVEELT